MTVDPLPRLRMLAFRPSVGRPTLARPTVVLAMLLLVACGGPSEPSVPTPVIQAVSPAPLVVGSTERQLTVTGTGFIPASSVQWRGSALPTTYVSATTLRAQLQASDFDFPGIAEVRVVNDNGVPYSSFSVDIVNPQATLATLSTSEALTGASSIELTVRGTQLMPHAIGLFDGKYVTSSWISTTEMRLAVPSTMLRDPGVFGVQVSNDGMNTGRSNALPFSVRNAVPFIQFITPGSSVAGRPDFVLMVEGSGYVRGSVVHWNGTPRTTTYLSPNRIDAVIRAADVQSPGDVTITVVSPAPGGGTSGGIMHRINAPM